MKELLFKTTVKTKVGKPSVIDKDTRNFHFTSTIGENTLEGTGVIWYNLTEENQKLFRVNLKFLYIRSLTRSTLCDITFTLPDYREDFPDLKETIDFELKNFFEDIFQDFVTLKFK